MERFVKRHRGRIVGILAGFDRVVFRGTLRSISYVRGLEIWLASRKVPYKEFGAWAEKLSRKIKDHGQEVARRLGRPWYYLESSRVSKEALARQVQQREGVPEGLICVIGCVEPCQTFALGWEESTGRLVLRRARRKCLHLYFYYQDREFGLMHVRIQTWLPFMIQVYVNGREWLAQQMERAGIGYQQRDNCFTWIEDLPRAQRMLDRWGERKWARLLHAWARRVNPWLDPRWGLSLRQYYWSIWEGEYATDVMFRDAASLAEIYPALTRHALEQFRSPDVLRFLGRRTDGRFRGEVQTQWLKREEGVRVKHRVEENSLKMYDKQGSILRVETTINNPRRFAVRRRVMRQGRPVWVWRWMRKGLADLRRRVQVSRAANARYLEALAVVGEPSPCHQILDPVSAPVQAGTRSYRPLRPISPEDSRLFEVLQRGEFLLHGFRNRDLRPYLLAEAPPETSARRRASARLTRSLRLLHAHGLIYRLCKSYTYRLTQRGHQVMTASLTIRNCNLALLAA